MCVLRPCNQKVTLSLQCESWILHSWTAVCVAITNYACDSQTQTNCKTNDEWANHVGSVLLDSFDIDVDVSVVLVLRQWLYQLQNYSRDTSKELP